MSLDSVQRWMLHEGRFLSSAADFFRGFWDQLIDAGLSVMRCNIQVRTMHPEVAVRIYIWRRTPVDRAEFPDGQGVIHSQRVSGGEGVQQVFAIRHTREQTPEFLASPMHRVMTDQRTVHVSIGADAERDEFPVMVDLRGDGATGYLCCPIVFGNGLVSSVSLATDKAGGFSDGDRRAIEALLPVLSMCVERHSALNALECLLQTYLGREPAHSVLAGRFLLGDVREVQAAIWFSDLRDFTNLAAGMDSATLVRTLNDYFAAVSRAIEGRGGEILKFIGDAVLVLFPVHEGRDEQSACADALAAAHDASRELETLNAVRADAGQPALAHGVGLHFGRAEYGNVGAPTRLDFTVVGHAVNIASRIAGLCRPLERGILASRAFASRVPEAVFTSEGTRSLKGVPEPVEVVSVE